MKLKEYSYPADSVTVLPVLDVNSETNVTFYNQLIVEKGIDVVINQNGLYECASLFSKVNNKKVRLISVIHNNPLLNYNYLWSELSYLRNNTWIERVKRIARCLLYFKIKKQRLNALKEHYAQFDDENHSIIVLLSPRYKQPLLQIAPYLSQKIYTIANPNSYEDIPFIPQKEKEILFVGRMDNRSKKVNRLLRIWKKIYREFPDWSLSLVGDGPDRKTLEEYSEKHSLDRIHFYGFSNPRPFYERASIICMTSDFEGFPMVLTEAMQFGCIPIAYDSFESVRDVIIHGKTGLLIPPFSEKKFVNSLKRVMLDNELRERLSIKGSDYVKKFGVATIIKDWVDLMSK